MHLARVSDEERLARHYRDISPAYHVTKDDAPTLLLHGDADKLVPLRQSELIRVKFRNERVPHRLIVKEGGDHGWPPTSDENSAVANWFDKYLTR